MDLRRVAAVVRAARRVLLVVIVLEQAVFAVHALDSAGIDHSHTAAAVSVFTADLLASWCFIARANYGAWQRGTRQRRGPR